MAPLFNSNDPEMSECGSFSFEYPVPRDMFRCLPLLSTTLRLISPSAEQGSRVPLMPTIDIEVER